MRAEHDARREERGMCEAVSGGIFLLRFLFYVFCTHTHTCTRTHTKQRQGRRIRCSSRLSTRVFVAGTTEYDVG